MVTLGLTQSTGLERAGEPRASEESMGWGPRGQRGRGTQGLVQALMLGAGFKEAYPWCWDGPIPVRTWLQADSRPPPGDAQTPSSFALGLSFLIC